MKMDVSKFKKVSSDKNKTVLMHPSGHKIVIAHAKLNPVNLDQLDRIPASYKENANMADGGEVASKDSDIFTNTTRAINKRYVGRQIEKEEDVSDELTGDDVEAMERGESFQAPVIKREEVSSQKIQRFAGGGAAVGASRQRLGLTKYAAAIDSAPVPPEQASQQNNGVVGEPSPLADPVDENTQMASPMAGRPYPAYPAYQAPPHSENDPYAVANETALKAIQKQQEGAQQGTVAVGEAATRAASADAMAANALNNQNALFQKNYQDLAKERQALFADWQNKHVDPQRYIKSMSTGDKILKGIGLLFSGMGSGMTRQPDDAFKYLNDQINRDIDAQKSDFQNKGTLLQSNLAQSGDLFTAAGITRMNILDLNAMHLKQIASESTDPIKRAELLSTSGKLDQEAASIQAQIAQRQALMETYKNNGEENFQKRMHLLKVMGQDKFADDVEKRHVPGVGNASREVPADVLTQITARNALNDAVMDLQNYAHQNSGSLNPAAIAQGKAKAAIVQDMVRQAANAGVFKESEKEFMNRYVGEEPTQLFEKYRSGKGYEEVRRNNLLNLNALKSTYGMPVSKKESSGAQGTPNLQKRGDSTYMKVPGGWKKVK